MFFDLRYEPDSTSGLYGAARPAGTARGGDQRGRRQCHGRVGGHVQTKIETQAVAG
jgi:hypothetical protein